MDGTGVPVVKKETVGRKGKTDGQPAHTREVKRKRSYRPGGGGNRFQVRRYRTLARQVKLGRRPARKSSFVRIPRSDKSIELPGQVYLDITRSVFKTPDLLGDLAVSCVAPGARTSCLGSFIARPARRPAAHCQGCRRSGSIRS
jgi:hypothetical protein